MPIDIDHDLMSIREWIAKEDYLPRDLGDVMIKKFLHSCYGSLERTKKCIEKFCIGRCNMPELFTNRDPSSAKVQQAFSITSMSTYEVEGDEMLIHQFDDPTLEKFDFYDILKAFTLQADYWLNHYPVYPNSHILALDMKNITLRILPKSNVFYFRQFIVFLLEAMPVRIKQIHLFNCPSYYEKLFLLVKPVLPQEICDLIHFHPNVEGLYSFIDKKYLPMDLGGEAIGMKDQHNNWVKEIDAIRKMYLNDNLWKADLSKKSKTNPMESTMSGSFRSLSID